MRLIKTIEVGSLGFVLSEQGVMLVTPNGVYPVSAEDAYHLGKVIAQEYATTPIPEVPRNPSLLERERLGHEEKSFVGSAKEVSTADELSHRSAGGVEAATKLKVGDAFKAPGDYSEGRRAIHGVEKTDLGQLSTHVGISTPQHRHP